MRRDQPVVLGKEELRAFLEAFPTLEDFTQKLEVAHGSRELAATADGLMRARS